MKDNVEVIEGRYAHAIALQGRLRRADSVELYNATGKDPDQVILDAWKVSHMNSTIMLNDKPVAIFGAASIDAEKGSPWMVGSDEMRKASVQWFIARKSKKYIDQMLDNFSYLVNFVDIRNDLSIKWLKWCGFKFYDPAPFGAFNALFCKFDMGEYNV